MNTITLTINNIKVEVEEGTTVLAAAQAADIYSCPLC